jgi:hypothetical protein
MQCASFSSAPADPEDAHIGRLARRLPGKPAIAGSTLGSSGRDTPAVRPRVEIPAPRPWVSENLRTPHPDRGCLRTSCPDRGCLRTPDRGCLRTPCLLELQ